jgi:hypothetical protein
MVNRPNCILKSISIEYVEKWSMINMLLPGHSCNLTNKLVGFNSSFSTIGGNFNTKDIEDLGKLETPTLTEYYHRTIHYTWQVLWFLLIFSYSATINIKSMKLLYLIQQKNAETSIIFFLV